MIKNRRFAFSTKKLTMIISREIRNKTKTGAR